MTEATGLGDISPIDDIRAAGGDLKAWLIEAALPTWHAHGVDRDRGGFHEVLGLDLAIAPHPRRTRVLARQIYAFVAGGRLGWQGPWQEVARHGTTYFLHRAVGGDGYVRLTIEADGRPRDDSFSLYDQAFGLFGFAAAAEVEGLRATAEAEAVALRDRLARDFRHPERGFEEGRPPRLPLKSNPHMHLLEACLAWEAAGGDPGWSALADEIAALALDRLIDPESGWLREFFDAGWRPMPGEEGRICEPGHQFEWAWLLVRWGKLRNNAAAIAAARRLVALGERFGVDPARGVAVNRVRDDGTVLDPHARLWPQTERIKGHLALASVAEDAATRHAHRATAAAAARTLARYLAVERAGLWRDSMAPDGDFRHEPAPASTFYHIVCAIAEIDQATEEAGG